MNQFIDVFMHNNDLWFDLEKITGYTPPITIAKAYEPQFDNEEEGYPYAIDVEDNSYWYANEEERDADYDTLKNLFSKFYFC